MFPILRSLAHMLQISAMVGVGFALLSLIEGESAKKLANVISRRILARLQRKSAAR